MIYDKKIDKTIVKELDRTNTAGYLELYRKVCAAYKRISRAAYDFHMKKLLSEKALEKRDSGQRGKPIIYSLTAEAKQKLRLQILEHKSKKEKSYYATESEEEKRQILYVLLFLFQNFPFKYVARDSEGEFDTALKECGLTRNDLTIERTYVSRKTYVSIEAPNKLVNKVRVTEFKNSLGFVIYKLEEPVSKVNRKCYKLIEYRIILPGISLSEFSYKIHEHVFEHFGFTEKDLDSSFNNLVKEGLLKICMKYYNESRYIIADKVLRDMIHISKNLLSMVLHKMQRVWAYIRRPTEQDKKWLQILHGMRKAEDYLSDISRARHSLTKRKRRKQIDKVKEEIKLMEEKIDQEIQYLKKTYGEIINKYRFPSEKIIEILYPTYLQRSLIKQNI